MNHGRKNVIIDLDGIPGIMGGVAVRRDDHGHGLSLVPNPVPGQEIVFRNLKVREGFTNGEIAGNPGSPYVLSRENFKHIVVLASPLGIDGLYPRVCVRTSK
jgi:hypothetical protein